MTQHLATEILTLARASGRTITTAESCTGGMVSAAITEGMRAVQGEVLPAAACPTVGAGVRAFGNVPLMTQAVDEGSEACLIVWEPVIKWRQDQGPGAARDVHCFEQ